MANMREAAILSRRRKQRERLERELRAVEAKLTSSSSDEDSAKKRCREAAVELQQCAQAARKRKKDATKETATGCVTAREAVAKAESEQEAKAESTVETEQERTEREETAAPAAPVKAAPVLAPVPVTEHKATAGASGIPSPVQYRGSSPTSVRRMFSTAFGDAVAARAWSEKQKYGEESVARAMLGLMRERGFIPAH